MAKLSGDRSEVNARIVYWGVEGSGKTTSIQAIASKLRADHRGRLRAVPTGLDPSVHYDVLPIELGSVAGIRTRFEIVGVPGASEQGPTRQRLLDQVDGVVFVVDAQPDRSQENLASLEELRGALAAYGRSLAEIPLVVQYNKRDLADPYLLEELHRKLDMRGAAAFESVATQGTAVLQALTTVSKAVIRGLRESGDVLGRSEPETGFRPGAEPALEVDAQEPRAGAQAALDAGFDVSGAEPPAKAEASLAIASVGPAEILDDHRLRFPLVLVDPSTRRRVALTLTLQLDATGDEVGLG